MQGLLNLEQRLAAEDSYTRATCLRRQPQGHNPHLNPNMPGHEYVKSGRESASFNLVPSILKARLPCCFAALGAYSIPGPQKSVKQWPFVGLGPSFCLL